MCPVNRLCITLWIFVIKICDNKNKAITITTMIRVGVDTGTIGTIVIWAGGVRSTPLNNPLAACPAFSRDESRPRKGGEPRHAA